MVEVFKTNVQRKSRSIVLKKVIEETFPTSQVNFDLDDCDKILRIEAECLNVDKVVWLLKCEGFECEVL